MTAEAPAPEAPSTDDRTRTGSRLRRARTERRERVQRRDLLVDVGFVLALAILSGLALGPAFGGTRYLVLVGLGAFVGAASAVVATVAGRGWTATAAICAIGFVLFSGPAVDHATIAGILPGPALPAALMRGLIHSWSDATTTAPPIGVAAGLGVIPYVAGFVVGLAGTLLARRTDWPLVPALPVVAVLVLNIVLATLEPQSLVLQGGLLLVVALGWGAIRANRPRREVAGGVYWPRIVTGTAMLAAVGAVGVVVGPALPFTDEGSRQVIREHVEPPFDPSDHPSPLNGFRNYIAEPGDEEVFLEVQGLSEELMEIQGSRDGVRMRLVTMDTYDGTVWAVGGPDAPASGIFDRVGTAIVPTPPGSPANVDVEVVGYRGIWVPTVGATRTTRFEGDRADELIAAFRFNRATGDGASSVQLAKNDRYRVELRLHDDRHEQAEGKKARADIFAELPPLPDIPDDIRDRSSDLASGAIADYEKAVQLEEKFLNGFYSNGGPDAESHMRSAPGHSLRRISSFLEPGKTLLGNAEQYAATMALVARMNGLPARVVMGFEVPEEELGETTQVLGTHVHAWVEIAFEDVGWVVFDPTPPRDKQPDPHPPKESDPEIIDIQPDPEHNYLEPPDLDANRTTEDGEETDEEPFVPETGGGLPPYLLAAMTYVGGPTLLAGLGAGSIAAAKATRRKRRRTRGAPAARVAGAWRETIDTVRDTGGDLTRGGTRRETAASVPDDIWAGAGGFAAEVDQVMFGPDDPTDGSVERLWEHVDEQRRELLAPLSRTQKVRAAISLRSLRRFR